MADQGEDGEQRVNLLTESLDLKLQLEKSVLRAESKFKSQQQQFSFNFTKDESHISENLPIDRPSDHQMPQHSTPEAFDDLDHELLSKEQELKRKAKELEEEMRSIKQAKVQVVIRQFEQQLLKEAKIEQTRIQNTHID